MSYNWVDLTFSEVVFFLNPLGGQFGQFGLSLKEIGHTEKNSVKISP